MEQKPPKEKEEIDFFELDFSDSDEPIPNPEPTEDVVTDEIDEPTPDLDTPVADDDIEEPIAEDEDEVIKANFEFLKSQGALFLPEDYEFKATAEGLEKAIAESAENFKQNAINDMFSAMPQEGRDLLTYYLNGGTNVKEFMQVYSEVDPTSLDIDNEEHQEWAVRELLKETTQFSDARIERTIKLMRDDMRLKEEAQEAITELQNLKEAKRQAFVESEKQRQEEIKRQAAEQKAEFSRLLSELNEINGIPYSKEDANKAIADIYSPVRLTDGSVTTMFNYRLNKALSDPKTVALLNKLMESDFKLDSVARKKTTDATSQLRKKLKDAQKFKGSVDTRTSGDFDFSKAKLDLS